MIKLTTELLEKFVSDIKTDGMCDITDSQVESALIRLLAYKQAGKETKIYQYQSCLFHDENGEKDWYWDDCDKGFFEQYDPAHRRIVYTAPVLPKQPELLSIGELLHRLEEQTGEKWVEESAQPVIPEHANLMKHSSVIAEQLEHVLSGMDVTDHQRAVIRCSIDRLNKSAEILQQKPTALIAPEKLDYQSAKDIFNYLMNEEETNATVNGWNACRAEMLKAQPVSEPYKLPVGYFSYGSEHGFDWHKTEKEAIESAEAAIDDYRGDACDGWSEETDSVCWGVILQQATKVDERPRTDDDKCDPAIDTVCDYALLPELVGNSPVMPDGWKLVPIEPTPKMLVAAMGMFTAEELAEAWGDMIEAAPVPARESE